MVLSPSLPPSATTIVASLLFLVSLLDPALSQTTPTVAVCGPLLVPLMPCAAFVQGQAPAPTQQCCDNLVQMYNQQRGCLCLLLNGTAMASLPINSTRALQLPGLCSPQIDPSTCSSPGGSAAPRSPEGGSAAPGSPGSQVSFKKTPGDSAAAPTVTVAPRPSTVRFGMGKSSGYKLRSGDHLGVLLVVITLVLAKLM